MNLPQEHVNYGPVGVPPYTITKQKSASSLPCAEELLQGLAYNNESSHPAVVAGKQRRDSIGSSLIPTSPRKRMLSRTGSLHRLLGPSKVVTASQTRSVGDRSWGHESTSTLDTVHLSLVSLVDECETAVAKLRREMDDLIGKLSQRKAILQGRMASGLALAEARYEMNNSLGAVLSMRKAHKMRVQQAYVAAARYQIVEIRAQILSDEGSPLPSSPRRRTGGGAASFGSSDLDAIYQRRRQVRDVMCKMNLAYSSQSPIPSDEALLSQLKERMRFVEI